MKIPPPAPSAIARFEKWVPQRPSVTVKKVFGQPAAFANGNMFFGVYGADLFVRLGEAELAGAARGTELRPFEPMPGRPMKGYAVIGEALLTDTARFRPILDRSLRFAEALPPRRPKGKGH